MKTSLAERQAAQRWREKNPGYKAVLAARAKQRRATDPAFAELTRQRNRDSYARNPAANIASHTRWRNNNPSAKRADGLRSTLRRALFYGSKTRLPIGCTVADLRLHFQRLFSNGMDWTNHGSAWEVDHIKPCSDFDLTNTAQVALCFHWSNLRPLPPAANRSKYRNTDQPLSESAPNAVPVATL